MASDPDLCLCNVMGNKGIFSLGFDLWRTSDPHLNTTRIAQNQTNLLQAPGSPLWKIQVSSKVSRESLILCFPVIISVDYPNFLATKFKPSLHQVVLW